jgi:hypothetical protein
VGIDQTRTQPYQPIGRSVLEVQWHQIMTGEKWFSRLVMMGVSGREKGEKGPISQPMYVDSLETP